MNFPDFKHQALIQLQKYSPEKIPQNGFKKAAVIALFYEKNNKPHLLLNKRTDKVATHKNQISFPGGGWEKSDKTILATALRELNEEMGIVPNDVKIWGESDDFITVTDYWVKPFLGEISYPYNYKIQESEIAEIIEVPLQIFLNRQYFREELRKFKGKKIHVFFYTFGNYEIWGATAFMINRMIDIIFNFNPSSISINSDWTKVLNLK